MNVGTRVLLVLSIAGLALAVHIVARHRPGRFMLVRAPDAGRHRAGTRRVLALDWLSAITAAAIILAAPDPTGRAQLIAAFSAFLIPPLSILVELRWAFRGSAPSPVPSRFRVPLERPPGLLAYLSLPLEALNAAAMMAPPVALALVWKTDLSPWLLFFLPLMLFLTALVLFSASMQVRERWVLPAMQEERYVELQHEKRLRAIRLLEAAMVCWNVAGGIIWISVAAGDAGPGYLGGALAVLFAGPGVTAVVAARLPRLIAIADELAALAGTEALGTRRDGWRWGGFLYCSASDPALFVPKRNGLGQTLNLGRPAAWLLLAGVLLAPPVITAMALTVAQR